MGNHESINRIEQNKEQGAQCVNKHIKMIPSQGGRNHYHPPPAREGFGMLMTCLNLSSPHYQIEPVALGPRGAA